MKSGFFDEIQANSDAKPWPNNNNNLLQLACHPVAVVILHVYKT